MSRPKRNMMLITMVQLAKIIRASVKGKKRGESYKAFLADVLDSPVESFSEDNAKKIIRESNNLKGRELVLFQMLLVCFWPALYAMNMGKGESKYKNEDTDIYLKGLLKASRQADYYHLRGLYEFDNLGEFESIIQQLKAVEEDIYNFSEEELDGYQSLLREGYVNCMHLIDPQLKNKLWFEKGEK
jgi:hypothetical protein